jgi:hypothetical protein
VGSHPISAVYSGSANYSGSTSAELVVVVNQAATSTTLASSLSPSVFGKKVTFTARVAAVAPGTGTPTGSVTFYDGSTTLGTATLVSGKATFATTTLTRGSHMITAVYSGDPSYTTSTAAPLTQAVK